MSTTRDPTRWSAGSEEAPEAFARLLRADEGAATDPAQLARVLEGVARQLERPELAAAYHAQHGAARPAPAADAADPGLDAQRSSQPGMRGRSHAALKLGVGLLALGIGFALWQAQRAPEPAAPQQPVAAPARTTPGVTPPPAPAAPPADVGAPAPAMAENAPAAPQPTPAARPAARGVTAPVDPLAELQLLEPAQRALRDDPARTLSLAERHRARFARGQFEQEREMLAIEALLRLERAPAARTRAHAFERRFLNSSHLPRLRGLIGQ